MDHLSTMKRKNVVLVYDLLLEMLDSSTASSSCSQMAPSLRSGILSDQQPDPDPSALDATAERNAVPPHGPAEALHLDQHLETLALQPTLADMGNNE